MKKASLVLLFSPIFCSIIFAAQFENSVTGLLAAIDESKKWDTEHHVSEAFEETYQFDGSTGALKITEPFADYMHTKWREKYNERDVLITAESVLSFYPLTFKDIRTFEYSLIWKDKTLFYLKADENELNTLKKKMPEYRAWLDSQPQLLGKTSDAQDVEYNHKIFSNFKNLKLNI